MSSTKAMLVAAGLTTLITIAVPCDQGLAQEPTFDRRYESLFQTWAAPRPRGILPGNLANTKLPPFSSRSRVVPGRERWTPTGISRLETKGRAQPKTTRQNVNYSTTEPAGTVVIDTANTNLYYVLGSGEAIRYSIGVGRDGFTWAGRERISRMAEWPEWRPPKEMLDRDPSLPGFMPGGLDNPLGARALYLGQTLYRIHGTNQPSTVGQFVSSGCIRMLNEDVMDLYRRVSVGTKVVVLDGGPSQVPHN